MSQQIEKTMLLATVSYKGTVAEVGRRENEIGIGDFDCMANLGQSEGNKKITRTKGV